MTQVTESRVAIITGGASGIGLALATDLVSKNWHIVIADINPLSGATALKSLSTPLATFHLTDVSSWDSQLSLFQTTFSKFGRIDFFAANAGIDDVKSIYEETEEEKEKVTPGKPFLKVIDVDFIGVVYGVKLAGWYMRRNPRKGGCVVLTSSAAGLYPMSTNPLYAGCKAALINFTRSVASTYLQDNIRVNAICPALVPTAIFPGDLKDFFPEEHITPVSTIVAAYDKFITDDKLAGKVVECSQGNHFFREQVGYPSESQRWMNEESGECWARAYDVYFAKKGGKA
ncbi:hypothetical protein TWF694_004456 [Orbilia ellipsospora]|uniref:15-hydroxyprostaglandin dehydrogenase n=1 Tax=Orbilia ellipsospora TaxID=2528407 RepID=A0AAV9WWL0_9PEZI